MNIPYIGNKVKQLRRKFSQSVGLPIKDALPESAIESALAAEKYTYRQCFFDPILTIWAFLSQTLDSDRSCRKAISRVMAYQSDLSEQPPDAACSSLTPDTGAYCKARQRLPESVLKRLYQRVSQQLEKGVDKTRLWFGRRVFLADGTTVLLPDTPENQAVYPQHPNQKEGCGFPLVKLVVLFSLTTGAVIDAICDVWSFYEPALLRLMCDCLKPLDVLVCDRLYCSYADIFFWGYQQQVDVVFRLHQARKLDFRKGKRLGKHDRIFTWEKPKRRPKGIAQLLYDALPPSLEVRVIRFTVDHRGYRSKTILVATTLLDSITYPKNEIAALYERRWEAEIDLRHLKTSMDMDMLRTKSPEMARKEIAIYFLAYNLIRSLMDQAAKTCNQDPLRLSFKGTLQHLNTFLPLLAMATLKKRKYFYETLLCLVGNERLPDRPHRFEPRVVKRRPKSSRWMQEPRAVLKQKLSA
jgi:hypothetical protein